VIVATAFRPDGTAEAAMLAALDGGDTDAYLVALASAPVLIAHVPRRGAPYPVLLESGGRSHLMVFTSRTAAQRGNELHGQGENWNLAVLPLAAVLRQWRNATTWLLIDPGTPLETRTARDDLVARLRSAGVELGDMPAVGPAGDPQPLQIPIITWRLKRVAVSASLATLGVAVFLVAVTTPGVSPAVAAGALAAALFGTWWLVPALRQLGNARRWQHSEQGARRAALSAAQRGRPPTPVVAACACMVPVGLAWLAAGVGVAGSGLRDPSPALIVTLPLGAVCLLLAAFTVVGIARALRGQSAQLRAPATMTVSIAVLLVIGIVGTAIGGDSGGLSPTMLVPPVLALLAGLATSLLRAPAAAAWLGET